MSPDDIMGLDISLNSTGYAYTVDGVAITGTIKPGKLRGLARLHHVATEFGGLLGEKSPGLLACEDYSMGSKGKAFHIGEMGGVLKLLAYRQSIPLLLVPPASLKIFVTGNGASDKPAVAAAAVENWGVEFDTDDEVDAYALMQFAVAWTNPRKARGLPALRKRGLQGATYAPA